MVFLKGRLLQLEVICYTEDVICEFDRHEVQFHLSADDKQTYSSAVLCQWGHCHTAKTLGILSHHFATDVANDVLLVDFTSMSEKLNLSRLYRA